MKCLYQICFGCYNQIPITYGSRLFYMMVIPFVFECYNAILQIFAVKKNPPNPQNNYLIAQFRYLKNKLKGFVILLRTNFYVILSHEYNKMHYSSSQKWTIHKNQIIFVERGCIDSSPTEILRIEAGRRRHRVQQSALPKSWLLSNFVLPNILLLI